MRELERVQHRYDSRTGSVARQFDRICNVLNELGYLDRLDEGAKEHIDYRLTERGQLLRHLYSELDLVLAQAIDDGAFDGLDATELASAVMSLIYEPRRGSGGEPRHYPGGMQGNVAVCAAQLKGVHAPWPDHTWVNAPKRSLRSRNRRTRTSTVASSPIQVSTEHVRNREIGFRGRRE